MSLKDQLASFKAKFLEQVSDEMKTIVGRNMQALLESGQEATVPSAGATFPAVSLSDSAGQVHQLGGDTGTPQVVSFFRGFW